jgi:hypothetical protein
MDDRPRGAILASIWFLTCLLAAGRVARGLHASSGSHQPEEMRAILENWRRRPRPMPSRFARL